MSKKSHYWKSASMMIERADSIEKILYVLSTFCQYFDFQEETEIIELAKSRIEAIMQEKKEGV